jgi:hypothetical protein
MSLLHGLELLHNDRDFDALQQVRGCAWLEKDEESGVPTGPLLRRDDFEMWPIA